MFGLLTLIIFLFIGAAVDLGRWMNARSQTASAIDSAVLAGARALQVNGGDQAAAVGIAQRYYAENTKGRFVLAADTIEFKVVEAGTGMTAAGAATIATPFLSLANIKTLPVLSLSGAEYGQAQSGPGSTGTGGSNTATSYEISIALDITGSMCDTPPGSPSTACKSSRKLDAMKAAAKDLVNIVVWKDQSRLTSKVAIVPFSAEVRPKLGLFNSVADTARPNSITVQDGKKKYKYNKTPCVAERPLNNMYTDYLPDASNKLLTVFSSGGTCWVPSTAEVEPLSNDKVALVTKIEGLTAAGGTAGHLGTAWAYYMLSPLWSSILSSGSAPASFDAPNVKKIAIIMTDGEYNVAYDANGLQVGVPGAGNPVNGASSASQAASLCEAMKIRGVTIYTVGFELDDVGNPDAAKSLLSTCASSTDTFYDAADGEQLKQAFRDIALKISQLYLSR